MYAIQFEPKYENVKNLFSKKKIASEKRNKGEGNSICITRPSLKIVINYIYMTVHVLKSLVHRTEDAVNGSEGCGRSPGALCRRVISFQGGPLAGVLARDW